MQNPDILARFYQDYFGLTVTEEIPGEWVVLNSEGIELALHRVGEAYRGQMPVNQGTSNAKLVFEMKTGIELLRSRMQEAGISMRELKRYEGFAYQMCDGQDSEGNVFQLMQPD